MKALDIYNFSMNGNPIDRNNCEELFIVMFTVLPANSGETNSPILIQKIKNRLI